MQVLYWIYAPNDMPNSPGTIKQVNVSCNLAPNFSRSTGTIDLIFTFQNDLIKMNQFLKNHPIAMHHNSVLYIHLINREINR